MQPALLKKMWLKKYTENEMCEDREETESHMGGRGRITSNTWSKEE
jgi:hypothetical protein